MSSNQDNAADRGRGRGRGRGGRGRGRGGVSVGNEILESVRVARQVDQRRVASLSAPQKKELLAKKRQKELHRILLPDAPPRKRRTQRQSPEREACEMAPSTSAEAAQRPNSPLPSTSRSVVEAPVDSPPLIVVPSAPPALVEFDLNENDTPPLNEIEDIERIGTPDLDTAPNSPSSLDSMVFSWLVVFPYEEDHNPVSLDVPGMQGKPVHNWVLQELPQARP